jgi:antitoxin component YwqK of YwqJK toxin-antitoxin module/tetratricopeptide (TPR) repeat protein
MTTRSIALILALAGFVLTTNAQDNNPLIVSGQLLEKAGNLFDSGQYKKAIAVYGQIDRNDTNYVQALYRISSCLYADSQFTASIATARQALDQHADPELEPNLLNEIGIDYTEEDSCEQALRVLDSAIRKYPYYALLYLNKGTTLIKLERYAEAESVLEQSLLYNPYSYSSHYKLGVCAISQGKLVPAMLSFTAYLLLYPNGRYYANSINWLNRIAYNKDTIQTLLNRRTTDPDENYQPLEQILQSKISLDKSYKSLAQPDDAIIRQIQVLFEKMQYQQTDSDFYMQYYIPLFKTFYTNNQFEPFINRLFSSVNNAVIQDYVKKHKKELAGITDETVTYFTGIRSTQILDYTKRGSDTAYWSFDNSDLSGHGAFSTKTQKINGAWTMLYAPGNIKGKGFFNSNGNRDGDFTFYYFDGKVKGKEFYRDGKQEGEETYYYANGMPSSHSWYKDGKLEGESTSYFWVGTPNTITRYHADKEEGAKITFYDNGDTSLIEHYSAGELDGEVRSWSHLGLEVVASYRNGLLDGVYKKYYPNGQLTDSGLYTKGKQEGEWKWWYANGHLKTINHLLHDEDEGEKTVYYDNGQISQSSTSRSGKLNGPVKDFDDDGKLYSILLYSNDNIQKAQYFDKTGKLISESVADHNAMHFVRYFADGAKRAEADFNKKGNPDGPYTFYYENGHVSETDLYKDGTENGASTTLYLNGKKSIENIYADGKKEGYHQSWYSNGQCREEGWYSDDKLQGNWLYHNEMGTLTDSVYYMDDVKEGYKTNFYANGKRSYQVKYHGGWMEEWIDYDTAGKELKRMLFPGGTGKFQLTYSNGQLSEEVNYLHGKLNGTRYTWYFDGRPMSQGHYTRGIEDSSYVTWFHNGQINTQGRYAVDEKTGLWKYYSKDGRLAETAEYKRDDLDGAATYYYADGKIRLISHYKEGKKEGAYTEYDPDGTLIYQINYHNDDPVSYSYWDSRDSLVPAIALPLHSGKVKALFPNGKVSAIFEYVDGNLHGDLRMYYTNGQLEITLHYEYGDREGPFIKYYPNGKTKETGTYRSDNLHGPYREYNDQGVLTLDETYYNGSQEGISRSFDDTGKPKETDLYFYGTLLSAKK